MANKPTKEQLAKVIEPLEITTRKDDSYLEGVVESGVTVRFLMEECMPVKAAVPFLEVSQSMYIHQLIWSGKLEAVKIWMGSYEKWFITRESLQWYKDRHSRAGKPKKYILKCRPGTYDKVMTYLKKLGEPFELYPNYRPRKTKEGK